MHPSFVESRVRLCIHAVTCTCKDYLGFCVGNKVSIPNEFVNQRSFLLRTDVFGSSCPVVPANFLGHFLDNCHLEPRVPPMGPFGPLKIFNLSSDFNREHAPQVLGCLL